MVYWNIKFQYVLFILYILHAILWLNIFLLIVNEVFSKAGNWYSYEHLQERYKMTLYNQDWNWESVFNVWKFKN
jgi:hypothetical protein